MDSAGLGSRAGHAGRRLMGGSRRRFSGSSRRPKEHPARYRQPGSASQRRASQHGIFGEQMNDFNVLSDR